MCLHVRNVCVCVRARAGVVNTLTERILFCDELELSQVSFYRVLSHCCFEPHVHWCAFVLNRGPSYHCNGANHRQKR